MLKMYRILFMLMMLSGSLYAQLSADSLPSVFIKRYLHKDITLLQKSEQAIGNPFAFNVENKSNSDIGFAGLNRSGSISRAITFVVSEDMICELLDNGRLELAIPYITYYIRPMELIK